MALSKKMKIIVISSISTTVLVLGLGVGLGVGLSNTNDSTLPTSTYNTKQLPSGLDYEIDKDRGKLKVNNSEYDYLEENGEQYVIIPEINANFDEPIVDVPLMFNEGGLPFERDENGNLQVGQGKDYFYKMPFFRLNVVKITNDGKI